MHNFRTEPLTADGIRERVFIDNLNVQCTGYTLRHDVGKKPVVEIEIPVTPIININADLKLVGIEDIAKIMDEDMFNEFCEMWQNIHC